MTITQGTKINDGTAQFIVTDITDGIPVGDVVYRPYLKDGYLIYNGQTVNRSDYPRLVALADKYNLWTTDQNSEPWKFGQGDGSITMTMPKYKDRVIQGGETASKKEAGLPNITAQWIAQNYTNANDINGDKNSIQTNTEYMIKNGGAASVITWTDGKHADVIYRDYAGQTVQGTNKFNASKSNSIYGNSNTVQPPAIILIPQMKY